MALITCTVCGWAELDESAGLCPRCKRDPLERATVARPIAGSARSNDAVAVPAVYDCCGEARIPAHEFCPYCGPPAESWAVELASTMLPVPDTGLVLGRDDATTGTYLGCYDNVSRRHASVAASLDGIVVTDLDSTNGTFVDGTRLPSGGSAVASAGSEIALGSDPTVRLRVSHGTQS